jgi:hypothetical protein
LKPFSMSSWPSPAGLPHQLPNDFLANLQYRSKGALIVDICSSGGARSNLEDGMGAPTSSLASLEWRPRRTSVFRSPSAELSSPNSEMCCLQDCCGKRQRYPNHGLPSIWA